MDHPFYKKDLRVIFRSNYNSVEEGKVSDMTLA